MNAIKFVKLTAVLSTLFIGINAEAQLLGRGGSIGGAFGGTMGGAMNGSFNNMGGSQDVFAGRGRTIKNNATGALDSNADATSQIKQKATQASADASGAGSGTGSGTGSLEGTGTSPGNKVPMQHLGNKADGAANSSANANGQGNAQAGLLGDFNPKESTSGVNQNTGKATQAAQEGGKSEARNTNSFAQASEANGKAIGGASKQASINSAQNTSDSGKTMRSQPKVSGSAGANGNAQANASTSGQSAHE